MKQLFAAFISLLFAASAAGAASCNWMQIRPKICELAADYEPDSFRKVGKSYKAPNCNRLANVDDFSGQIEKLFKDSDFPLQDEMCWLKNIFVLPAGNYSWGKYEDARYSQDGPDKPKNAGKKNSYIFLAHNLINSDIQTVTKKRLTDLRGNIRNYLSDIYYVASGAKSKSALQLAFASVIAHEIGHIKFHRPGDNVPNGTCFQESILPSWSSVGSTLTDRWRDFGDYVGQHSGGVPAPADVMSPGDVESIYDGGFASALAAASPEEDYVESYTLAVITSFSSDQLTMELTDGTVIDLMGRNDLPLKAKLNCAGGY